MARIIPAVVRDGVIVVDPPLEVANGTEVRVIVAEPAEELVLGPEEEADLLAALEESERGEGIPWDEVRRRLERFE